MLTITETKSITFTLADITQAVNDYLQKNNILVADKSMDMNLLVSGDLSNVSSDTQVMTVTLTEID